jgi:hypothetical protein
LFRITLDKSRHQMSLTSPFSVFLMSHSNFTNCRVEWLPSKTMNVLDQLLIIRRCEVKAFPAVYRTPSLCRHLLVMNS